ncbi:PAS domain-containing methyl-accepting chemotaxis protein [soil metagenome]
MRTNLPVTQHEYELPDDTTLMSTTDVDSHITYANAAFVAVSGFTLEELQGLPHNIVRHPDMPVEAFADMWATLKAGEPWTALVKNRRKNGDHYWVRANAIPVVRDGRAAGYMSVRTKASREEIAETEKLYRLFREGKAGHLRFHKGLIVRRGAMAWSAALQTLPVRWRARAPVLAFATVAVTAAWACGLPAGPLAAFSGAMAVGALLAIGWLDHQISSPLAELRELAVQVASGASRRSVQMNRVDEIGMSLRTVSQLGCMFRWIIDDVSGQVLNVRTATHEIAQGNNDLSSRTEQAAASVEETASSMEQMTVTVRNNADTAAKASELSRAASDTAASGGRAVSEVVATMDEITRSSKKIADIIGTIDGIAFQTNILALNAAVEAARAGEQGRGFAVVAAEVRSLAQRSAEAAKEIKSLIGVSVSTVESGAKRVDDAGKTMADIVSQVQKVSELIAEISLATREQSAGVAQVGTAVGHIDQITQQNAALVEQSAAASESLVQQTTRLAEAINVFR